MTAIGLAVFVVAKWLIEKKPWDSDLVELGLIAVVLFAGNYYREGARDS